MTDGEVEEYSGDVDRVVAPRASDAPAADAVVPDETVVDAGEWGVVRYTSTEGDATIVAVKPTGVAAGEPGALGDVMAPGVHDLDRATPYYVSYVWAPLSGDADFSPAQDLVAGSPADATTLSVPRELALCDPPAAHDYGAGLGYEQRGCAVVASTAGPPSSLVFQGPEGSSAGVTFTLPAP
ncbi:hypothetical protein [Microbacterium sp. 10M-3C3]|uniref:hypothetical protein n=1 Tax=Microbacterium sp. 10M-3C3 TaxID=2483401 RepID=UPI000F644ED7|nr:hypothetical protein [Microbacterium sp. 10M-3C3]